MKKVSVVALGLVTVVLSACSTSQPNLPSGVVGRQVISEGEDWVPTKKPLERVLPDNRIYFLGEYSGCVDSLALDLCKKAAFAEAADRAATNIYNRVRSLMEIAITSDSDNSATDVQRDVEAGTLQIAKAELHGLAVDKFFHRLYLSGDSSDKTLYRDEYALGSMSKEDYDKAVAMTLEKIQKKFVDNPQAKQLIRKMEDKWLNDKNQLDKTQPLVTSK